MKYRSCTIGRSCMSARYVDLNWPFSRKNIVSREGPPRTTDQPPGGQRAERAWGDVSSLYPVDPPLAEESLGPYEQEEEREHVGEPVLDAAARESELADQRRSEEHLRHLLADADGEPAHDRAGNRLEATENDDRQRLQRDLRDRELDAELAAPHDAADDRDDAGHRPD